jgi:dTDP-4-dehydrorhamnose reductase
MRIAVTGRNGQLALSLLERSKEHSGLEVIRLGRPELDLARPQTIAPALAFVAPDIVVSAAAFTGVDAAEDDRDTAFAVNADGAGGVAAATAAIGIPVIHLSTDYVFSGGKSSPYVETDEPDPLGVYGASKLLGERMVAAANPRHLVLRTAWVYSPFGQNFVKTMLKLARTREDVAVVGDQWGSPTSALDLAEGIIVASRRLLGGSAAAGIYHLAGLGETNWCGFAREIFELSRGAGAPFARVHEIASAEYPQKARRPANSRLDSTRFATTFNWTMPEWKESLAAVVRRLVDPASQVEHDPSSVGLSRHD